MCFYSVISLWFFQLYFMRTHVVVSLNNAWQNGKKDPVLPVSKAALGMRQPASEAQKPTNT